MRIQHLSMICVLAAISCSTDGGDDAGRDASVDAAVIDARALDARAHDARAPDTGPPEVLGCGCGSTSIDTPCLGTSISYVRMGDGSLPASTITFEFECDSGPCACGLFANGYDYWVAPPSEGAEVRIVNMTPTTVGEADASLRNGWVANPSAVTESTFMDGRLGEMADTGRPLRPTRVEPYIVDTSATLVTTVVKSHSMLETGDTSCGGTDDATGLSRHCFWQAATLTVLSRAPADSGSTVFRPPLTGAEKPLLSTTDVAFDLLPDLPRPTQGGAVVENPTWAAAVERMGPPKVEWAAGGNWPYWQYMPPLYNFSGNVSGYPPRSTAPLLDAMQLLAVDGAGHEAEKRLLTIRAVQWGLDNYYMWKARGFGAMYRPNGGHAVGRYLAPVVAAALMRGPAGDQMRSDMLRVNNGTADRCGFDISGEIHYWSDTDRVLYGYFNIPGCDGYSDYTRQTNSNYVDPSHMGDNGRLAENADNDTADVGSCFGAYQPITVGPTHSTANLIRAIPAARAIAFEHLIPYVSRMVDQGASCRSDQVGTYTRAFGTCDGGTSAGEQCRNGGDCPGSTCTGNQNQYTSWLARNMWSAYADCYDARTCPGMEGL